MRIKPPSGSRSGKSLLCPRTRAMEGWTANSVSVFDHACCKLFCTDTHNRNDSDEHARYAKPSDIHGLLSEEEYRREVSALNDKLKTTRAKKLDYALLATGAAMVPLALWAVRHSNQVKKRKKLLEEGIWEFNERMAMSNRNVRMIYHRAKLTGGAEGKLMALEISNHVCSLLMMLYPLRFPCDRRKQSKID